ncbi:MAG: autotransporter outer membrane beta-barrel domain-containing protein [Geminicoccaceae bacterium]
MPLQRSSARDLEQGRLLALSRLTPEQRLGLNSFVMGDGAFENVAEGDGARSSFEQVRGNERRDVGFGLNYAFSEDTMMGFAVSSYENGSNGGTSLQSSRVDSESQAFAFYFNTEASGIQLRTVASFSDDSHHRTEHDGLIGATNSASFGGETMAISQTASLPLQIGGNWFTPWVNLSHTVQKLDSYTLSNPYLSDTTYKGDAVSETFATIGLSTESGSMAVGDTGSLKLTGRVSYSQSLSLDDYRVSVREQALGYAQSETIERDQQGIFGVRLGAELGLDEQVSLTAGYAVDKQTGADTEQSVRFGLSYRF